MSALAQRKSMSTTSYFGSRVEVTLNRGSHVKGYLFGLLGSLEATRMLGEVGALIGQLLHVRDERLVQRERLSVLDALDVAVERVLD
jgi:hypothetical protein